MSIQTPVRRTIGRATALECWLSQLARASGYDRPLQHIPRHVRQICCSRAQLGGHQLSQVSVHFDTSVLL